MRSILSIVLVALSFCMINVSGAPQGRQPPATGLTGLLDQWFNGGLGAANSAFGSFLTGANTGFQGAGNGAQDLFDGALASYNAAAGGLVDGFETIAGVSKSIPTALPSIPTTTRP